MRATDISVSAAADLTPETLARLRATIDIAIAEDGAGAIILGSGALAGRAAVLGIGRGVPVIDRIRARIRLGEASAALRKNWRARGAEARKVSRCPASG